METPGPQEPERDEYGLLWYWDNATRSWTRYPSGQQNDPDWSHATGGDNDLFASDQNPLGTWEKTKNPMGEGITAGFFPSEEDANEARGGRNWETNNVRLWMMNEQPTMQQAMQIVGSGGTPDDLENWVIQDYLAQHNQDHLQDAQDWNSMPEEERLDRDYEGLPGGAKNIVDNLFGGPNVGDISANVIDPGLVDWNSLFQDVQTWIQEEQDDMTREAAAGFNDEGMPWSEEEWQNYQNNNDVAFNRKYEINPNDYSVSLQGIIEMGKEQIDNALQGGEYQFENGNINPVDKLNQLRHIAEDFASRAADQVFNNPQYAQTFVTENPSLMERPKDLFGNPEKDELDWPKGAPTNYKNFEDVWPDGKAVGNSNLFRIIADSLDQYIDRIEQQGNYMPMARVAEYADTIQTPEPMDQDDMVVSHPPDCPCEKCQFSREMDKQQQVHPRTEPFQDRVPHRNRMNYDDSFPSMISKTAEYEGDNDEVDDMYDDEYEDEPQEDDIVIEHDGTIYAEGGVIGTVNEGWDEGYKAIYDWQTRNQYYPTVWIISDHGNAQVDDGYSQWVRKYEREQASEQAYEQSDKDLPSPTEYNDKYPSGRLKVGDIVKHIGGFNLGQIIDGPRWSFMPGYDHGPMGGGIEHGGTYREYLVAWEPPYRKYMENQQEWTPEAYLEIAPNQDRSDTTKQMDWMVTQAKTAEYALTDTGAFWRVPWFVNPNTGEIEMAAPNAGHATMPNYDALYRDPTGPRPPAVGEFLNGKLHHYEGSNQSYGLDQQLRAKYNDHRQMFPEIPPLMYDRVHDYQETPDANPFPQIKLLGSEMSDDVKQPHEWRHVFDKFAWEDAQPDLASCNKCASPMIDKGAEKICHTCGNRQPIIYANRSGGALDGLGGAAALAAPWLLGPEVGAPVDAAELGAGAAAAGGGGGLGGLMGNIMGTGGNMLKMKGLESMIGGDPSSGGGGQQPPDTMDYEPGTVAHTAASDDGVGLAVKDDGQDVNPNIHSTDGNTNLDGDDPSHVKDHDLSSGAEGAKAELHQTVEQIMEHLLGLGEGEGQSSPIAQALDKLLEAMNPGYRGESPDATIMIDAIPEESAVGTESDSDSESSNDEPAHPDKVAALPGGNPQAVKALVDQYVSGAIDSGTLQRLLQDLKVQMGGSPSVDSGMPAGNMGYEMGDEMNPMGQPLSHVANLPMVPQQPGGSVPVMQQGPASMGDATEMGGPCEICGGAHNSAMHGAASPGGQGMHAVSNKVARRPKLCPYHSDLIDYSLQFGDPKEALGIIAPQQYGSQWCKSGEFRATCNFKPTMVKQEYWDQRENELQQRRFEREQETLLQQQEAPISQDEEIAEFSDMDSGSEGYTPAEVTDISAVGAPMEMAARTAAWTDANGNPLIEGQHYKLQSPKYDAPDEVIIKDTKSPNKLVVEIKSDLGISYEDEITPESVANNGFQFMPDSRPESEHSEFSPETNNEYPFYDEPGGVSDVSDLPTPVSHMSEPETDSLSYLMQDTGQFDGVDPVTVAKVAGKDFSHNEQMNFINEAGLARNIEELDLSGSHYGPLDGYLHDINDEFSMGW